MMNMSLGTIEVYGLPAALEAADVACKTANVKLIGYEATDGLGMVSVKIEGNVSAVQSAMSAARAAVEQLTKVFAVSVIPRPNPQIEIVVDTDVTVGQGASTSATALESKPRARTRVAAAPKTAAATKATRAAKTNGAKATEAQPTGTGDVDTPPRTKTGTQTKPAQARPSSGDKSPSDKK